MNVSITHVDTCLGCYLTDHHNRPGEFLVGIPCHSQSFDDALTELSEEIAACAPDEFWNGAPLLEPECREALRGVDLTSPEDDESGDYASLEDGDPCCAWFLVEFGGES